MCVFCTNPALRTTPIEEQVGIVTELLVFYGRAFADVREALRHVKAETPEAALWQAKAVHECVCGVAAFSMWQRSTTSLKAPTELARLTRYRKARKARPFMGGMDSASSFRGR